MVLANIPKKDNQNLHTKKRLGQHHRSTKHYTKTYWPYLPMLLVVLAGFLLHVSWNAGTSVLGYATDTGIHGLLQETNSQRTQNGQAALALNDKLSQAAQLKADDMVGRDYWSHTSPDGKQPWQFVAQVGYAYAKAGENLAYGFYTSSATVAGWMNSTAHRDNLLHASYQEVGFGVANAANYQGTGEQTIVVAMYAEPKEAAAPSGQTQKAGAVPKSTPKTAPAVQPAEAAQAQPGPEQVPAEPTPVTATARESITTEKKPAAEPEAQTIQTREVARIDVLTNGNAEWAALALSALATISIISFVVRHGRLWHRYLLRGERLIIRHPLLDTALVTVGVIGYVLTQSSGFIR